MTDILINIWEQIVLHLNFFYEHSQKYIYKLSESIYIAAKQDDNMLNSILK